MITVSCIVCGKKIKMVKLVAALPKLGYPTIRRTCSKACQRENRLAGTRQWQADNWAHIQEYSRKYTKRRYARKHGGSAWGDL